MENKLIITNNKETITSLELVEQINIFRKQEGNRADLQHYDLLKIIRDEFEEEIGLGKISVSSYKNSQNKEQPMYNLTYNQAKQILVRESKFVRRATIQYIEKLEQQLTNPKLPFEEKTKLIPTTWKGQPVIELQELAKMIGINGAFIHWHFQKEKLTLKENELREYKRENKTNRGQASLSILYKETVIAICKHFNVYEKYKDIIENYFKTDNKIEDKTSKVLTEKPFDDKYYSEMYECMQKAYNIESRIEKIYNEELLPLYNRIEKLNEIKRDCMISLFNGMKYGNILGKK